MGEIVSTQELCERWGVHRSTLARWQARGMPVAGRRPTTYDLEAVTRWRDETWRASSSEVRTGRPTAATRARRRAAEARGDPPSPRAKKKAARKKASTKRAARRARPEDDPSVLAEAEEELATYGLADALDRAKLRRDLAQARKYELDVLKRRGELLERAEVEAALLERIHRVTSAMESAPAQWSRRVLAAADSGSQRDVERVLRDMLRALREEYARE